MISPLRKITLRCGSESAFLSNRDGREGRLKEIRSSQRVEALSRDREGVNSAEVSWSVGEQLAFVVQISYYLRRYVKG